MKNKKKSIKSKKKSIDLKKKVKVGLIILVGLTVLLTMIRILKPELLHIGYSERKGDNIDASEPDIDVQLLTVNEYSRPGTKSGKIKGIVIHYTANPGASAQDNRGYFEGLKDAHTTHASSHFIVGLDGEIIQCIPTWEIAYASNDRNSDTVSIECCHPDDTGEFSTATYNSAVKLTAWLCLKFGLTEDDVIRHYDVTGKMCPKYYVEHEDEWNQFKKYVGEARRKNQ